MRLSLVSSLTKTKSCLSAYLLAFPACCCLRSWLLLAWPCLACPSHVHSCIRLLPSSVLANVVRTRDVFDGMKETAIPENILRSINLLFHNLEVDSKSAMRYYSSRSYQYDPFICSTYKYQSQLSFQYVWTYNGPVAYRVRWLRWPSMKTEKKIVGCSCKTIL